MSLPTFNLIGPGRLGRSLARLWHDAGLLAVTQLLSHRHASAQSAQVFIGSGTISDWPDLQAADFTLLAAPDDTLAAVIAQLAASATIRPGDVVFHASGALPSSLLAPLQAQGALVASVHPLKSFADPAHAITDFAGTYCGCEGDTAALARLAPLFDALGAQRITIAAEHKTLYHAGAVLACNDLVALMEAALRCMAAAGVAREQAWSALRPLITGTLANLDRRSTAAALTGPIARGDTNTVARQLAATRQLDPQVASVYQSLAQIALQLADLQPEQQASLAQLLEVQA